MRKIAYLLHRFPGTTDTFIKREIRSLQMAGLPVEVVSVWKPKRNETTPEILAEWARDCHFALPCSAVAIALVISRTVLRSPARFVSALCLAWNTSRPGLKGLSYQLIYFVQAILAADILNKGKFTHAHNHIGDHSGTVTMLAARLAGIGYSITFHGWPVFFDAYNSHVKTKVLKAEFTRSISYFCRSQLMMFAGADDQSSFKVVHCGLDLANYTFRPPRQEVKFLFCVARLSPEKGLWVLIESLRILRARGHELELRLAGDGPSRQHLDQFAASAGLKQHVKFLGYLTEAGVADALSASDIFVLPSFVEGLPVSAMEAMAIGVPVIATNIAGTSELVEDGHNGILIRPSDPVAIADAVEKLIGDYDFRLAASQRGREKVEREFEIHSETAKLYGHFMDTGTTA